MKALLRFALRRPRLVIALWLVVLAGAAPWALRLGGVLRGSTDMVAGSASELVTHDIDRAFGEGSAFVFPAVRIGNAFHGDGSIRMAAPLSPAVQLGAPRIIAMSTGYLRNPEEASHQVVTGYPPAAQILGQLVNAIFLDGIEEDVARMERMNDLLRKMAPHERNGMKPIDLLVLRPSIDLGKLAGDHERFLPRKLKLLVRAMGVKETESPDFVSLLMFEPAYTQRIIEIGEADVESRLSEIRTFLGQEPHLVEASR